jgi:hypothetical protein
VLDIIIPHYPKGLKVPVAVIHYKAPEQGSALIDINQVYLCDSGAQYLDGTPRT